MSSLALAPETETETVTEGRAAAGRPVRVLLCCGFFESTLPSYREYAYSRELARLGFEVTLLCGDQSQIWSGSRIKLAPTDPAANDADFVAQTGVRLLRRKVFARYSDFVLFAPVVSAIRAADIVHVIEFRQGVTLLVALIARALGKPVVYDHEQRGDRTAKWYSRVDSLFRRALISLGSLTVTQVRHTVLANRDHFRSCALRRVPEAFAPLGADTAAFFFDADERARWRDRLGIGPEERVAAVTGKLHGYKKIPEIVAACRRSGYRPLLVGAPTPDVREALARLPPGEEIHLATVSAEDLRGVFNAADVGVYTTFTLSYWEALATGLPLVVPRTAFTELALGALGNVTLFGAPEMFAIPDEQYRDGTDILPWLSAALARARPGDRSAPPPFTAASQARKLARSYAEILAR